MVKDAYGLEKLASEECCRWYGVDNPEIQFRVVRFHNIYGEDSSVSTSSLSDAPQVLTEPGREDARRRQLPSCVRRLLLRR